MDKPRYFDSWKVKGSDLVNVTNGVQYRLRIQYYDTQENQDASDKLVQNIFNNVFSNFNCNLNKQIVIND